MAFHVGQNVCLVFLALICIFRKSVLFLVFHVSGGMVPTINLCPCVIELSLPIPGSDNQIIFLV